MIPRPWLVRAAERRLRDLGHAKSWAVKQASIRSTAELFAMLPLHQRVALRFRHAWSLLAGRLRRTLGLRSGE